MKWVFIHGTAFIILFSVRFLFVRVSLVIQLFVVRIDLKFEIIVRIAVRLVLIEIPSNDRDRAT
jgi:hypothetical protein